MKLKTALSRFVLIFVGLVLASPCYSQSFLTNGLVAYYPFIGNANDASGNGDNGVVIHATLAADRFGRSEHAFHFDGTSQIGIQATGAFLPIGSQARTISLWLNPENLITSGSPTWIPEGLFQYGNPSVGGGLCVEQIVLQTTPGLVSCYFGTDGVWDWNAGLSGWDFSRWHHAVWTYDGYHVGALYIDGSPVALASASLGMTFGTQPGPLLIGAGAGRGFTGNLDDLRFYNRALSASEIQQLYSHESHLQPLFSDGLVAYYPFNGNANDASGNGNHGIVRGAQLSTDRFGRASGSYATAAYLQCIDTSSGAGFPAGINDFTISMWVALNNLRNDHQILFCNGSVNDFQLDIWPTIAGSTVPMDLMLGGDYGAPDVHTDEVTWELDQWYNLQIVRAQRDVTIYRDGMVIGQTQTESGINAALGDRYLRFGAGVPPQMHQFYGKIDDIRIYNYAFTVDEVQALYSYERINGTDSDGDGMTDFDEDIAGTNLNNSDKSLKIIVNRSASSIVTLDFISVVGKRYQLERNDDYPKGNWKMVATGIIGNGATIQAPDLEAADLTHAIYRIVVLP